MTVQEVHKLGGGGGGERESRREIAQITTTYQLLTDEGQSAVFDLHSFFEAFLFDARYA